MMRRIILNSRGHLLKNTNVLLSKDYSPSMTKVDLESPSLLQRIQGDICGPIHLASGPFRYFMVLVDAPADGPMFACYPRATSLMHVYLHRL